MNPLLETILIRLSFSARHRQKLWNKLAANTKHGLQVYLVLESLLRRAQVGKKPIAIMYAKLLRGRDAGTKFGAALAGYASPEEIQLILAGEASGNISSGFELSAQLLSSKSAIRKAIIGGCAYPFFLTVIMIVMLIMISTEFVPQFADILPPEQWGGAAAALYAISSFAASWAGLLTAGFLICLCAAVAWSLPKWTGKLRVKFDGFGPWGIYRLAVGSSWLFSVATLMRGGLAIRGILHDMIAAPDCTPYLRERLQAIARQYVDAGKNFGESLADSGMNFPSEESVDDICGFSSLPDFDTRLFEIARDKMCDDIETIQSRMKKANVLLLFMLFFEICGLLMAITSLQSQITI